MGYNKLEKTPWHIRDAAKNPGPKTNWHPEEVQRKDNREYKPSSTGTSSQGQTHVGYYQSLITISRLTPPTWRVLCLIESNLKLMSHFTMKSQLLSLQTPWLLSGISKRKTTKKDNHCYYCYKIGHYMFKCFKKKVERDSHLPRWPSSTPHPMGVLVAVTYSLHSVWACGRIIDSGDTAYTASQSRLIFLSSMPSINWIWSLWSGFGYWDWTYFSLSLVTAKLPFPILHVVLFKLKAEMMALSTN